MPDARAPASPDGAPTTFLGYDHARAARMSHPAWVVADLAPLIARCEAAGHPIEPAVPLPGFDRVHVYDPFGNRLELMQTRSVPGGQ